LPGKGNPVVIYGTQAYFLTAGTQGGKNYQVEEGKPLVYTGVRVFRANGSARFNRLYPN
jgi:hypothetical protein